MRNSDVAHKFFYDLGGSFDRRSMTVSYGHNKYYSYGTVIGQITEDINGNTICLISDCNFSMTTAKHLNELRYACPYKMYRLPQQIYNKEFSAFGIVETLEKRLEWASNSKLTQKANREYFTDSYYMLKNTLEISIFQDYKEKIEKLLNEYKELYTTLTDDIATNELKKKLKQKEAEKQAKLKKELDTILNKYSYLDVVKFAYSDYWFNDYSIEAYNKQKELKTKVKKYLNPNNDLSFIWFEDNFAKTSQHISVDKKEAIALLKLWLKGKLKHGMTISHYTVMEVTSNYVKIGCHKIPVENIKELAKSLELKEVA